MKKNKTKTVKTTAKTTKKVKKPSKKTKITTTTTEYLNVNQDKCYIQTKNKVTNTTRTKTRR